MTTMTIIAIFGFPVVMIIMIVWFKSKERMKRYEMQADAYAKALEKGQTVPDDLFEPAYMKFAKEKIKGELVFSQEMQANPLNVGIICVSVGIGISLFIWLVSVVFAQIDSARMAPEVAMYIRAGAMTGVVPFLIGVAFLIIHFISKKKGVVENAK